MSANENQGLRAEELKELGDIRGEIANLLARLDRMLVRTGLSAPPAPAAAPVSKPPEADANAQPKPADANAQPKPAEAESLARHELKDAVIAVLRETGKPMTVEAIHNRLRERGARVPSDKPKLALRKILFNKDLFTVERGAYVLRN
jgi:hypothetical protein